MRTPSPKMHQPLAHSEATKAAFEGEMGNERAEPHELQWGAPPKSSAPCTMIVPLLRGTLTIRSRVPCSTPATRRIQVSYSPSSSVIAILTLRR